MILRDIRLIYKCVLLRLPLGPHAFRAEGVAADEVLFHVGDPPVEGLCWRVLLISARWEGK